MNEKVNVELTNYEIGIIREALQFYMKEKINPLNKALINRIDVIDTKLLNS